MIMISMERHHSTISTRNRVDSGSSTYTGDKDKGLIIDSGSGRVRIHPHTYARIVNAMHDDVDMMVMLSENVIIQD